MRFKRYTTEWTKINLSNYLCVSSKRNKDGRFSKEDVLSVSGELGIVNQIALLGRSYAGESVLPYHIVEKGDIVYTKSPLALYPYGIIKTNRNKVGIVSTLYAVYKTKDNANNRFIEHYFSLKSRINNYLKPIVRIGAKHDMKIGNNEVLENIVAFPDISEQCEIADFLDLLDNRISVQNKIISKYETLIKGLSCDYFSKQPNHTAKLKDLIIKGKAGGTPSSTVAEYYNGDIPFLSISDITKQGKYVEFTEKHISENGLANSSAWIVPSNSLILSMYASVGLVCINKVPLATSQAMFSMVLKDSNMLDYIYYYLNFFRETQIHRLLETGTQSNINADTVRDIEIPFYSNILVFVKTLQAIENRLNNEKDMLSRLMDLKTYLLSSLFI